MPSFIETRFPEILSKTITGGPEFSTSVVTLASGHEQRNINWSDARARYNVAHGVKTEAQLAELLAFFRAVKGKATGFRFKDWTDYQAAGEILGTGDGSKTEFQLIKRYTAGSTTVTRAITKPVTGTVKVYIDTVELNSGFIVDTTTGVVTFSSPPNVSDIISADFEFDVPVRFDTDVFTTSFEELNNGDAKEITLLELRA